MLERAPLQKSFFVTGRALKIFAKSLQACLLSRQGFTASGGFHNSESLPGTSRKPQADGKMFSARESKNTKLNMH